MKKILILMISVIAMFFAMTVVKAYSAVTITEGVSSQTITRVIEGVTNPVTSTFTYKVEADSSNPAAVADLPANFTIAFNNETPNANNKVTKTGTLDLSSIKFSDLGTYKFKVTEISSSNADYPVDNTVYYVYVQVRDTVDANGVPQESLIAKGLGQAKVNDAGSKVDIEFNSKASYTYIELSKNVAGNLARKDDYFAFTFTVPGNGNYTITGNHSTNGSTEVSTSTFVAGTQTTIYLKHGQSVKIGQVGTGASAINQIPIGTKVTITETDNKGYDKTTINGTNDNRTTIGEVTLADVTDTTNFNTNNVHAFKNIKEEQILSGLFLNILPFVILLVLGAVGIHYIKKTSHEE